MFAIYNMYFVDLPSLGQLKRVQIAPINVNWWYIENTWKIDRFQIRRWYSNSDKTTDIIIHRFQVKEILNLIIVNPFASRFNNGTPPPCESWLLSDSDGYTNDNQLNIRSGFLSQTIKKMMSVLRRKDESKNENEKKITETEIETKTSDLFSDFQTFLLRKQGDAATIPSPDSTK